MCKHAGARQISMQSKTMHGIHLNYRLSKEEGELFCGGIRIVRPVGQLREIAGQSRKRCANFMRILARV
eukprot:1511353-Pleurochrysis_carterae.AAC.3